MKVRGTGIQLEMKSRYHLQFRERRPVASRKVSFRKQYTSSVSVIVFSAMTGIPLNLKDQRTTITETPGGWAGGGTTCQGEEFGDMGFNTSLLLWGLAHLENTFQRSLWGETNRTLQTKKK